MKNLDFDIETMNTRDISGFGGGYEEMCQKMLKNGLRFLKKKTKFDWKGYKQYQNIYGVCSAENKDAKALDKAIMKDIDDCSGAMHQAVVNHLAYICMNGLKKWIKGY